MMMMILNAENAVPVVLNPYQKLEKTRLEELRRRVVCKFDMNSSDNGNDNDNGNGNGNGNGNEHRRLLFSFGKLCFGENFSEDDMKSAKWKSIGFQGNDPATDFRGAGVFGLENLKYFVGTRPAAFKRMVERKVDIEYFLPFALTGLNLTFMLTNLLQVGQSFRTPLNEESSIYYQTFLDLIEQDEYAFEEIYCSLFLCLEERWNKQRVKYMDFQIILEEIKLLLCSSFKKKPADMNELKALLGVNA